MTPPDTAATHPGAPLADIVAAAAAERDATPSGRLSELGLARHDPRRTTPFVDAYLVDTGERRLGSEALTQLYL